MSALFGTDKAKMSSSTDAIQRSISSTERQIGSLNAQAEALHRELDRLSTIRGQVSNQRSVFFDDLARRRHLASTASSVVNVSSVQRFGTALAGAIGSSFEAGVDGELLSLIGEVDTCTAEMQARLNEVERQMRTLEHQLDQQRHELKVETAREQAEQAAEGR